MKMISLLALLVACGDKDEDTAVEADEAVEEASEPSEEGSDTGESEDPADTGSEEE
jgi:hypothetical protein